MLCLSYCQNPTAVKKKKKKMINFTIITRNSLDIQCINYYMLKSTKIDLLIRAVDCNTCTCYTTDDRQTMDAKCWQKLTLSLTLY